MQRPTIHTQRPTLQRPTLQRPTIQRPTIQRPTTQRPTIQRPTLQRPTLQRPTIQRPNIQRPNIQRHISRNCGPFYKILELSDREKNSLFIPVLKLKLYFWAEKFHKGVYLVKFSVQK
jgi:hypothetical protein